MTLVIVVLFGMEYFAYLALWSTIFSFLENNFHAPKICMRSTYFFSSYAISKWFICAIAATIPHTISPPCECIHNKLNWTLAIRINCLFLLWPNRTMNYFDIKFIEFMVKSIDRQSLVIRYKFNFPFLSAFCYFFAVFAFNFFFNCSEISSECPFPVSLWVCLWN